MKRLVIIVLTFLVILYGCKKVEVTKIKDDIKTDSIKFASEYKNISKNNIYEYETYDNIIDIINNNTGIIYLGFPKCILCDEIVPILNNVAKSNNIKKISYYNFKEIRQNKNQQYMQLLGIVKDYLGNQEEDYEILAPLVIFVKEGNIIGIYQGILSGNTEELITSDERRSIENNFKSMILKIQKETTTKTTISNLS